MGRPRWAAPVAYASGALASAEFGRLNRDGSVRQRHRIARLTPLPALLAVTLDLYGQLLTDHIHGVLQIAARVASTQRHALQVQGGLGDAPFGYRGIVFLEHLNLELGQLGHLLADHAEPALNMLAQIF